MPPHWQLRINATADPDTPMASSDVRLVAGFIADNRHFRRFLRNCKPENRRRLYDAIKPHLGFRVWPYWLMP